ncbi:hypothetical protein Cgig2_010406 [Carnegiea gigantea]|uniref:Protein kinase domain-containing protein n=1 Tax=Carnegiea gigantea TaxID=171969 RepID=A0A9Q1JRG8_9CARY|nr:hypothetical protein Cgig2_010406 [Carnegiea gigantea]
MDKFLFLENLGEGTYGMVCRALNKETGELVAIKTMKMNYSSWEQCLNLREIKCLRKLNNHDNIVKLKEFILQENIQTLHLVFESMDCSLLHLIKNRKDSGVPFSESEIRKFAFQVLQGLAHMHKNGVIHRDLKPENLLVSEETKIKIADLGMAKEVASSPPCTVYFCTRWYRAPEVILRCERYNSAVDMWAVGVIIAEMFTLKPLFPGKSEADMMHKICSVIGSPTEELWARGMFLAKKLTYEFPRFPSTSMSVHVPSAGDDAISLIRCLCSWDPVKRPTAEEAMQHPFFTSCFGLPRSCSLSMLSKLDYCMRDCRRKSSVLEQMSSSISSSLYGCENHPIPGLDWETRFGISQMMSDMTLSTGRQIWESLAPPISSTSSHGFEHHPIPGWDLEDPSRICQMMSNIMRRVDSFPSIHLL